MPTPEQHAVLSASASSRWTVCTAAPRFEQQFPETTSEYAEEGRLAHAICELKVLKTFTAGIKPRTYTARLNKLKENPLYTDEMDKTSDFYIECLNQQAISYKAKPSVAAEVRVDLTDYIPDGFGTCDCVMIGGDTLSITDYKHGKGVPVSAEGNSQMRLYALGALKRYAPVFGNAIKYIRMTIVQPRISDEVSSEVISVDELLAWGEWIKPIALTAFNGPGEFIPGEHCRFCRGKAQCSARAKQYTALEEFRSCIPVNTATPDTPDGYKLTDAEIGELLVRGAELVKWYKDLEDYALSTILSGGIIPGWKAVQGRSNRTFSDQDAAIKVVLDAGYDEALIYERKAKSLSELEKLMGKTEFSEKLGSFVIKPPGKPTLAPASDKREAYSPATADFAEVQK